MELRERFPAFGNLIGSYLHQDWKDDYYWDNNNFHYASVVRYFKTHNPTLWIEQTVHELKELLALGLDEERLEDALYNHFALGTMPSYWNMTFKQWLEEVLKILEEPMEKTKKQFIPEFRG